jgi:hypothetical protein
MNLTHDGYNLDDYSIESENDRFGKILEDFASEESKLLQYVVISAFALFYFLITI